jgi:hypothetical protein
VSVTARVSLTVSLMQHKLENVASVT